MWRNIICRKYYLLMSIENRIFNWTQLFLLLRTQLFLLLRTQLFLLLPTQLFLLLRTQLFLFTSLYPVSRVYTTLSTLDAALRCNSEIPLLILILWLCLPNILKESSPYFLLFCINLFTTSTIINTLAEIVRLEELFASTVNDIQFL